MVNTFKIVLLFQLGLLSGINAACIVPDPPEKGSYAIVGSLNDPDPGSTMEEFQVLIYDCPAPNVLEGEIITFCENGIWRPEIPTCMRGSTCVVPDPPANGSYYFIGSDDAPVAGSRVNEFVILIYQCPAPSVLQGRSIIFCDKGIWMPEIPNCLEETKATSNL